MSLGPTNTNGEGAAVDGDGVNTGGVISSKDRAPLGNEQTTARGRSDHNEKEEESKKKDNYLRGGGEVGENDVIDNGRGGGSEGPSADSTQIGEDHVQQEQGLSHDRSGHTPSPLGPESGSTQSTDGNDVVNDEERHSTTNETPSTPDSINKKPTSSDKTESHQETVSPTLVTMEHKEQEIPIPKETSTNAEHDKDNTLTEADSREDVVSADISMTTNEEQETSGFDNKDIANGLQHHTAAGLRDKGSGDKVVAIGSPHVHPNDQTDDTRLGDVKDAAVPAVDNKSPLDSERQSANGYVGSMKHQQSFPGSEDTAISHGTDLPSSWPDVQSGTIPTQYIHSSGDANEEEPSNVEADVIDAATARTTHKKTSTVVGDDHNTSEGVTLKTESNPSVPGNSAEILREDGGRNLEEDLSTGTHFGSNSMDSLATSTIPPMTLDEATNKNKNSHVAGSSTGSDMNSSDDSRMLGMKSDKMGSQVGPDNGSLLTPGTMSSSSHNSETGGKSLDDTHKNADSGIPGMPPDGGVQDHTHSSTTASINNGSSKSNERSTGVVTDGLPNTTETHSLNVSRVNDSTYTPTANRSLTQNNSYVNTGEGFNAPSSIQQSLADMRPQGDGSLVVENVSLGAGELQSGQPTQRQHNDDISIKEDTTATHARAPQHGVGGKSEAQNQNSTIPPLSLGGHGTATVGGVNGGGASQGSGGQAVQGRDREKSVFLRLSNQIQELEMNMSLFSSYLDQITARFVVYCSPPPPPLPFLSLPLFFSLSLSLSLSLTHTHTYTHTHT